MINNCKNEKFANQKRFSIGLGETKKKPPSCMQQAQQTEISKLSISFGLSRSSTSSRFK